MEKHNNWVVVGGVVVTAAVVIAIVLLMRTPLEPDGKGDHLTNAVDEATTGGVVKDDQQPEATGTVYENEKLSITIPTGWTASEVITNVDSKSDGATTELNPAAVNITNGKWILYVNVDASQASGVEGGRFAEIGMGAPSVDAVVLVEPGECGKQTKTAAFDNYTRVDLTISAADGREACAAPTDGLTHWFFSYLTSPGNGYFNDYVPGQNPGLVVTMAYDTRLLQTTDVVNALPVAKSPTLMAALKEMTDIASTLKIKNR